VYVYGPAGLPVLSDVTMTSLFESVLSTRHVTCDVISSAQPSALGICLQYTVQAVT